MGKELIHYDWKVLKREFMEGPWEAVENLRRDQASVFPKESLYIKLKMAPWDIEKKALTPIVLEKASLKLVNSKAKQLERIRNRHVRLAKLMQGRGEKSLKELEPQDTEDARKLLVTGLEQERVALGMG